MLAMTMQGWTGTQARRARVVAGMRQGYAELQGWSPHETVQIWLRVLDELLSPELADCETLAELGERVGLAGLVAPFFDNLVEVGRWLQPDETPEVFAAFERMLQTIEGRMACEPATRRIAVRAAGAHLLRAAGDDAGSEQAFRELAEAFPRSVRPITALIDSRLDAGVEGSTLADDLRGCEKLLVDALAADLDDLEPVGVVRFLDCVRMDLAYVERFNVEQWMRMPTFEVWAWPTPAALFELDPDLYDDFFERWGSFFID